MADTLNQLDKIAAIIDSCTLFRLSAEAKAIGELLGELRSSSSSVSEGEMPELPRAEWPAMSSDKHPYTADQMRDYGKACFSLGRAAAVRDYVNLSGAATKAAAPADAPTTVDDEKACFKWAESYYRNAEWFESTEMSVALNAWLHACAYARRASSVPAIPGTGRERAVAWALVSPKGGIKKVSITRQSVESRMARWLEEWPGNTPTIRPLVYGDADAAPSHPSEAKAGEPGPWQVLRMEDQPEPGRLLDVVLTNGVTEEGKSHSSIDWTQVADWRYSRAKAGEDA
ncbi:MAG: hypothetical protein ACRYGO_07495 [Janthinobacterium lividum]